MENKIKVLIVDDHLIFRNGLKLLLNEIPEVELIGECSDGMNYLERIKIKNPDIVMIDIKMPGMDGFDAIKIANVKHPDIKYIVLSMFGEEDYFVRMLELGVKGFLLKNTDISELIKAIKYVSEGKNYFSNELLPLLTNSFMLKKVQEEEKKTLNEKLSKREMEIMQLIAKGFTNREIAGECYISPRTVGGHRTSLLSKTGCKNTADLVYFALKKSLIQIDLKNC